MEKEPLKGQHPIELVHRGKVMSPGIKSVIGAHTEGKHKSWPRIDNCWISAELTHQVEEIEILPNAYADHNPITMTLGQSRRKGGWRLNTHLMREETFITKMKNELDLFFQMNKPQDTEMITIWDAGKSYSRGLAIQYNAQKRKERKKQYQDLLASLKEDEQELHGNHHLCHSII
ncbi:hypothetical protein JRQ81_011117 [Phrynocephalus forsythii]|uniref:Endonuclease/exonuclease/phosphatase domain-containing protein n=1 Tax=Phrynocephalus forsythii TaxID=171643 RepID=A0A9Q1ARE7_9SAUR|nr:hypothetical protein JRQ81_011117 [Phrynocephalus forsythii]